MMSVFLTTYFVTLVSVLISADATNVTVVTNLGNLTGTKDVVTVAGKNMEICRFLGIPYAEPPVGDKRFRVPVPKAPFEESMVVQSFGNRCFEWINEDKIFGSEDCLFLNIFVPKRNDTERLAVMVFIHGGGFIGGSGSYYIADILAAYGHVIVVTLNYRLSIWGFLSTEDSSSPGNYGLWDQRLAIKWVHDNIEAFGGDSNRITIFGESAGASSVIYQGLFPENQGLFQRIIAQSGSATAYWAYSSSPKQDAVQFATLVGCKDEITENMIECLRQKPANVIYLTLNNITRDSELRNPTMFTPSIDNVFVTCNPTDLVNLEKVITSFFPARNTFASFDLLTGINSGGGASNLSPLFGVTGDPEKFLPTKTLFNTSLVPILVETMFHKQLNQTSEAIVSNAIISNYTDKDEPENPLKIRKQFLSMHLDATYLAPLQSTVNAHIGLSTEMTYVYYFNVMPTNHSDPTTPKWMNKANLADEMAYLFPDKMPLGEPFDEQDTDVSKHMITMWSNFAKTGNPNLPVVLGINWPTYTDTTKQYLNITRNMSSVNIMEGLGESTDEFWNKVIPSLASIPDEECDFNGLTGEAPKIPTDLFLLLIIGASTTVFSSGL